MCARDAFVSAGSGSIFGTQHPTIATTAIIKRICFMPLRLTIGEVFTKVSVVTQAMQAKRPGKMAMEPLSPLVTLLHVFDCRYNKIGGVARKGAIISLNG